MRGFDLSGHDCEFVADDWVVDQTLAKGAALVCVSESVLEADASETDCLDDDTHTLVVKVIHNILHAQF